MLPDYFMANLLVEFYAMPNEQRAWLTGVLSQNGVWCAKRQPGTEATEYPLAASSVDISDFQGIDDLQPMFFLGRNDLAASPVWRKTARGDREIDFVRSQVVQIVPARVVGDVLLEGRAA